MYLFDTVAPHDGCVDWNLESNVIPSIIVLSHPTMGAWIEISSFPKELNCKRVAPHDGCVDWNSNYKSSWNMDVMSHPTMGAWIEIASYIAYRFFFFRRTPRWVRGLKYFSCFQKQQNVLVAPHDGCVDWNLWQPFCSSRNMWSHPTMGAWIEIKKNTCRHQKK